MLFNLNPVSELAPLSLHHYTASLSRHTQVVIQAGGDLSDSVLEGSGVGEKQIEEMVGRSTATTPAPVTGGRDTV